MHSAFYRDDSAVWLFRSNTVIANNPVYPAICAGPILGQATEREHRPFLKFERIPTSKRNRVVRVLGLTKEAILVFDLRSERLCEARFYDMDREIGNINPDPLPVEFFGSLDCRPATAERI